MRENLSAPGNVSDWLKISKQALLNLNYYNVNQDPKYARLSARYGYDDYFMINIRSKEAGRVLLEFDVSSPRLIDQFKTASAQVIRKIQNDYREKQKEREYGPTPTYNVTTNGEVYKRDIIEDTSPAYVAEEGDFIEQTRALPDDTLQLKQFRSDLDRLEEDSFRHKFRKTFNRLWLIWLMLILIPPFGIFLLWYFHRMGILSRILLTTFTFLYFVLIWIGFFGIDTGFNKESIQRFYQTQQYGVQRFLNRFNEGTDPEAAIEQYQQALEQSQENSEEPAEDSVEVDPYQDPGSVIQRDSHSISDDVNELINNVKGFFDSFKNFFQQNDAGV